MDRKNLGLLCGLSMVAAQGMAAPQYASIEVGEGMTLTPALDVEIKYDNNIFQSERNKKSSMVTVIAPAVELEALGEVTRFALGYGGNYGLYRNSSDDNFDNHQVRVGFGARGARTDFDAYGSFDMATDPRGTGPSDGLGDEVARDIFTKPTRYDQWGWGAAVHFGTRGSRSNLRVAYDGMDREYQNFRQFTRDRDRSQHAFSAKVGYALTGKTEALVNVERKSISYDLTPADGNRRLDSKEHRVTGGLAWEATGRTTGRALLGWKEKKFDSDTRSTADGVTWELGLSWAPRDYSVFDIYTRNDFQETDNVGSAKDVTTLGVNWTHSWSDRLRTNTGIEYAKEDYEDFARKDDFYRFNLGFDYDFQRWMTLGGGVSIASRDSNVRAADYDRNVVFIRAQMGL